MIYIVAPHSLKVNTTSHNRIQSFYRALKANGHEVKIFFPSSLLNTCWFDGQKEVGAQYENDDFITIETELNPVQKLAFESNLAKKSRVFWYLFYIVHYLIYRRDIYYTNNALGKSLDKLGISELDSLIVSSPPFGLFYEAYLVKEKTNCKLLIDYRDPWTYGYHPVGRNILFSKISKKLERNRENRILASASYITCVHQSVKRFFPSFFVDKIKIIRNGANTQYLDTSKIEECPSKFRIVYLGTIHTAQLQEDVFFQGVSNFIQLHNINEDSFELLFVGSIKCGSLHEMVQKYKLQPFTRITDRKSTEEALKIGYGAAAFLHLRYGHRNELITSKHADYLALQKSILLPVSDNGDIAKGIMENKAGYVTNNVNEFCSALQVLWERYQRRESLRINRTDEYVRLISRDYEARKLVDLIEKSFNPV